VHAELELDSSSFYVGDEKLGVGSSAAILVALAEALGHATGYRFTTEHLIALHNSLHGKNGSGLDVVAARLGGLSRFRNGAGERVTLPSGLHMRFVFSGTSTSTEPMLLRFRSLVDRRPYKEIVTWQELATAVADSLDNVGRFLRNLEELNEFVFNFDLATSLGIFGSAHQTALEIANGTGILYKPCGAGGGDTGVALSDNVKALENFERNATREGLNLLSLTMEKHGAAVQL
jgi:phosphomevalonate kinase